MVLRGRSFCATEETPRRGAQPEMLQPLVDSRASLKYNPVMPAINYMKRLPPVFIVLLSVFCSYGQDKVVPIVLTSKDVYTNSVNVTTAPTSDAQNLVFRYRNKSSDEIKAIAKRRPRGRVKVMKDGVVVAETPDWWYGGQVEIVRGQTNFIGLVLIFKKYDQAKLAEKALRGD